VTLQIRSISIYSREGERRDVKFKLGAFNIVTGASKTGKSALLDIVDYCWGRNECTVAEGEIRKSVSWFSTYFDHNGEGVLLARKNPGPAGRSSDEVYFARGVETLPDNHYGFHKNITVDGLKAQLSAVLGISENIHIPEQGSTRQPLEASSRHAIIFSLQGQDEIANRRLLFHRQGEQFFPPAIRDTLPYFLGAVDEAHFLTLRRYQDAKARLRRLERELNEVSAISNQGSSSARSLLQEARRVGLVAGDAFPDDAEGILQLLRQAATLRTADWSQIDDPTTDLSILDERRRIYQRQLQELRDEITDIERLNSEAFDFETEAKEQEARLVSIGLVTSNGDAHADTCPLCDSRLSVPVPTVSQITHALAGIRTQLASVRRDAPRLQERLAALESQRADLSDQLRSVQRDMAQRIQENERLRVEQNQFTEQARVVGRITYYLENVAAASSDSDLRGKVDQLRAEIEELERALDDDAMEARLATALSLISRDLTAYAAQLGLEHGENPLRLDLKNLTVVADTVDGPLSLAQMGSGENWVGYHVAAHLSLHRLFKRRGRPVPGFLMLDQPSQAHYPPERDNEGKVDGLEDEDQAAVQRLFELLLQYCNDLNPGMQIIVTDHVELLDPWFREAIAERWRDGIKLVPQSWLGSS